MLTRNFVTLLPLLAAGFFTESVAGFAAETSPSVSATTSPVTAVMRLWFRDSSRGTAVRPDAVLVDGKMSFARVDETGRMDISTTEGGHQVLVKAKGYDDMDSRQSVLSQEAPMIVMMLDPTEQPPELRPENLSMGLDEDSTVLAGFVADEELCRPIEAADVELESGDAKTKTDARGFFKLKVSTADGKLLVEDVSDKKYVKKNVKISKPGYGAEERLNVMLQTGEPKIFQVRLVQGGGGNALDEESDRGGLFSSAFGIPQPAVGHVHEKGEASTTATDTATTTTAGSTVSAETKLPLTQ